MKNLSLIISSICLCFICSCQQTESPFYEEVLKSEKGQFRGVSIGETLATIKSVEKDSFITEKTSEQLRYTYEMNPENYYTLSYNFSSDDELYAIELAVFLEEVADADLLFKKLSTHFNRKYSLGKTKDEGYITWQSNSSRSGNRSAISMLNDSESYGYLTVLIMDLDY
jgi:hypothetical protein